jgi:5,6-dimethylbenzimidazole synthase
LCLGYVREFLPRPELEIAGWLPRIPLEDLIFFEHWGQKNGK